MVSDVNSKYTYLRACVSTITYGHSTLLDSSVYTHRAYERGREGGGAALDGKSGKAA